MPVIETFEINSVAELEQVLGEKVVHDAVQETLDDAARAYVIRKDEHEGYYIDVDWTYDDLSALKYAFITKIMDRVEDSGDNAFANPQELSYAIQMAAEEYAFENDWFDGAEDYALGELASMFEKKFSPLVASQVGCEEDSVEFYIANWNWREYCMDTFDLYVNDGVYEQLSNMTFRCNIICATPAEPNGDFVSVPRMPEFVDRWVSAGEVKSNADLNRYETDNFLKVACEQQGYDLYELFVAKKPSKFLDSVRAEYGDLFSYMAAVTVIATIDFQTLIELFAHGRSAVASTESLIGFYDPFGGSGSILGIALEKELVIDSANVWDIQIENDERGDAYSRHGDYSVDATFGLVHSCWKPTVSLR